MQQSPGTITQRLQNQHPKLLPEVVTDLQVLKGEKLRERIDQRQIYLEEILSEGELLEKLLSPFAQKQFLEEHLQTHEIIAVLLSTDPESPFLNQYLQKTSNIDPDDTYLAETMISSSYLDSTGRYSPPHIVCKNLMQALWLLQEKAETIEQKTEERYQTQYRLSRGCELYAEQITKTRQKEKQQQAIEMFTKAHHFLLQSGFVKDLSDIDLILHTARAYRNSGDLLTARGAYLQAINQCNRLGEQLESQDSTGGSTDPVYAPWRVLRAQQLHDGAFGCWISSSMFYLQTLLEEIQENTLQDQKNMLRGIAEELNDAYDRLKERSRITRGVPSAYEATNLWRFTYGWYMMLVDEPLYAVKELHLLDEQTTPKTILQAADMLLEGYEVSFIDRPKEKPSRCIKVDMYAREKKR